MTPGESTSKSCAEAVCASRITQQVVYWLHGGCSMFIIQMSVDMISLQNLRFVCNYSCDMNHVHCDQNHKTRGCALGLSQDCEIEDVPAADYLHMQLKRTCASKQQRIFILFTLVE